MYAYCVKLWNHIAPQVLCIIFESWSYLWELSNISIKFSKILMLELKIFCQQTRMTT